MSYAFLKLIAMLTMYIDHVGAISYMDNYRYIGRISFVLYAFLASNAMKHTRSKRDYILNLFKFALISEFFYDYFIFTIKYPDFFSFFDYYKLDFYNSQNVFFTLAFGALACYTYDLYQEEKEKNQIFVILFCLVAPFIINSDYGLFGSLSIFGFYLCKNKLHIVAVGAFFAIFNYVIYGLFGYALFAMVGVMLILLYNGQKGNQILNKKVFYIFYPLHLAFLCILYRTL